MDESYGKGRINEGEDWHKDYSELYLNGNLAYTHDFGLHWYYANDDKPALFTSREIEWLRPCPKCGRMPLLTGEDACLKHIDGIENACCGHGVECDISILENIV